MAQFLAFVIMVIWAFGAGRRIYRQARFYQIEEYKTARYLRWLLSNPGRALPLRPLAAWGFAAAVSVFTDSVPGSFALTPYLAGLAAALIGQQPPAEAPIKKKFVATPRARRILGTAFALMGIIGLLLYRFVALEFSETDRGLSIVSGLLGLLLLLAAPAWLVLGNWLMIPVESALRARFIRRARAALAAVNPRVIGITGSYGKTTTKQFLRDILSVRYNAYATPKSYNTMMGVCIAINNDLANDYSVDYFICEMGAYIKGEIRRICDLTPPDISIVVEVGPQHLERFGSLENIAIAKYEIIKALKPTGLGVFNYDNPYVREMHDRGYPAQRLAVSRKIDPATVTNGVPRFVASGITETLEGLSFAVTDTVTKEEAFFQTPVVGEHNVTNILLATAVAVHEGVRLEEVARRVRTLEPAESRLVIKPNEKGVYVINDAYSANPVGIVSSLKVLGMYRAGRRVLITPGMVELGDLHDQENARLGTLATQYATDIILVGPRQTAPIRQAILATAFPPERLQVVNHVAEAIAWYQANLAAGDAVLLLNDLPDTY